MNEMLLPIIGISFSIFAFCFIIWAAYIYPIQAMVKVDRMDLKKKEIELKILKNK